MQIKYVEKSQESSVSGSGTNELGWFVIGFSLVFCEII